MTFKFKWLCELLDELENCRFRKIATSAKNTSHDRQVIKAWFDRYDKRIVRTGSSAIALLSCLFPERRPDRVYSLQEKRLSAIFGRALGLGHSRAKELNQWRDRDGHDFATCVENVMKQCEFQLPESGKEVTLKELNEALELLAANSPFSSPSIRAKINSFSVDSLLSPIVTRLHSSEGKWLVRLVLRSFGRIQIPEHYTMCHFHFMLPDLLKVQDSLQAAIHILGTSTLSSLPPRPDPAYAKALRPLVVKHLTPTLGVMIRRQPMYKARSIKNCCAMAAGRLMSIERKYDGEYCQIHIDMSEERNMIQIFSKSGKDSTIDRIKLHAAISDSLRLKRNGCGIKRRCILEGELLAYSWTKKAILPFHKIRQHVKRGGRYIGTEVDSPPKRDEQLMIAFYDVLVLDDKMLLNESHSLRRQYLKGLIKHIEGRAVIGERVMIDFKSRRAAEKLRETFANSITQRWEGLVLKPCEEPYFSWTNAQHGIKLKKDYISGLGDSADLCLVGGRRDARVELDLGIGPLRWTVFYVGCLLNVENVRRFCVKPRFRIVDVLTHNSMHISEMLHLNELGRLNEVPFALSIPDYDVELGRNDMAEPTELFKQPFIVEVMGAGFEKPSNSTFYTLRFPRKIGRKIKVHEDRSILETTTFDELQDMARQSMQIGSELYSQEDAKWIEDLITADGKRKLTQETSQGTTSTAKTPLSAKTMEFSPPSVVGPTSTPGEVFVRPDTEEPEEPGSQKRVECSNVAVRPACRELVGSQSGYNSGYRTALKYLSPNSQERKKMIDTKEKRKDLSTSHEQCKRRKVVHDVSTDSAVISALDTLKGYSISAEVNGRSKAHPVIPIQETLSADVPHIHQPPHNSERGRRTTSLESDKARKTLEVTNAQAQVSNIAQQAEQGTSDVLSHHTAQHGQLSKGGARTLLTPPASSPLNHDEPLKNPTSILATRPPSVGLTWTTAKRPVRDLVKCSRLNDLDPHPPTNSINETPRKSHDLNGQYRSASHASDIPLTLLTPSVTLTTKHAYFLSSLLSNVRSSLTYSFDHFVSQIETNIHSQHTPSYFIVLVDSCNIPATKQDLRRLAAALTFLKYKEAAIADTDAKKAQAEIMYDGRVLVFDYRVLHEIMRISATNRVTDHSANLDTTVLARCCLPLPILPSAATEKTVKGRVEDNTSKVTDTTTTTTITTKTKAREQKRKKFYYGSMKLVDEDKYGAHLVDDWSWAKKA